MSSASVVAFEVFRNEESPCQMTCGGFPKGIRDKVELAFSGVAA
jgi:hypothetical protein